MSEEQLQTAFSSAGVQTILIFLLIAILAAIFFMTDRKREKIKPQALTTSAMLIALAFVLNQITLFQLPQGGAVTPFSMLMIVLIGYYFGTRQGVLAGVAFGLLDLLINPYVVSIPQMLLDYPLAFGALGIGALLRKRSLFATYIVGVLGRYFCSFLSGAIFFGMYAPEGFNGITWSLLYNGTYLGAEAAITIVVLALPVVHRMIDRIGRQVMLKEQVATI